MKTFPIKDGVIDVIHSLDDGGYYLHRYQFSEKTDQVSKRIYKTELEAIAALQENRVRWQK